jgi:hypothetical protein
LWLQRYGVRHKVWLREGTFAELVPTSGGPFSGCLIDGAHDRQSVELDVALVVPHLSPGAVLGFHDYGDQRHPDVQLVADAAAARLQWEFLGRADYLAIFRTGGHDSSRKEYRDSVGDKNSQKPLGLGSSGLVGD